MVIESWILEFKKWQKLLDDIDANIIRGLQTNDPSIIEDLNKLKVVVLSKIKMIEQKISELKEE